MTFIQQHWSFLCVLLGALLFAPFYAIAFAGLSCLRRDYIKAIDSSKEYERLLKFLMGKREEAQKELEDLRGRYKRLQNRFYTTKEINWPVLEFYSEMHLDREFVYICCNIEQQRYHATLDTRLFYDTIDGDIWAAMIADMFFKNRDTIEMRIAKSINEAIKIHNKLQP